MKRAKLGSISHGTLRAEDLIPCFVDWLEEFCRKHPAVVEFRKKQEEWEKGDDLETEWYDSEEADYFLHETLFPALEEYAPDYCYFGATEGDGSDFGFWPCWSRIEDDSFGRDAVILKVEAGKAWPKPLPKEIEYVMEVNDHGNVSFFTRRHKLLWDCV